LNAITDVEGVAVGFTTLVRGSGRGSVGQGPVRTGVTAMFPRGRERHEPVFAGFFSLNGNGEMTGIHWLRESGFLYGPVVLTNTHSVGTAHVAIVEWMIRHRAESAYDWMTPVVSETWDGFLNDANGLHIAKEHVWEALDSAASGPLAEGNVGGGTGDICFEFKGGTGTASRRLPAEQGGYRVGALVQANHGVRPRLRIAGVNVGEEIPSSQVPTPKEGGSIVVLLATDAPLLPHQLERIARRCGMGVAMSGSFAGNGSGDLFLAFSTANETGVREEPARRGRRSPPSTHRIEMLPNAQMDPLFAATVDATDEAVINALVAAETMEGFDGRIVHALPQDRLSEILRRYGRLKSSP
jgi:D-aminopeptidase